MIMEKEVHLLSIHCYASMLILVKMLAIDSSLRFYRKQNNGRKFNSKAKQLIEESPIAQRILLLVVMLGTCMVIGDGALTPAISGAAVGISAGILLLLFLTQSYGTGQVSFLFSLVTLTWVMANAIIGVYNIVKYNPGAFKAINPYYIIYFFNKNGKHGWVLLGGAVFAIIGFEAMFAELGHFNKGSIQGLLICRDFFIRVPLCYLLAF